MNKIYLYAILSIAAFYLYFNRCPHRNPEGEGILSPADGLIVGMDENSVLIELCIFDVHCVRSPISGTVSSVVENTINIGETKTTLLQGSIIKTFRIQIDIIPEQVITRGERIGKILLGSHVRFEIPQGAKFTKNLGDIVLGGQTIIAR